MSVNAQTEAWEIAERDVLTAIVFDPSLLKAISSLRPEHFTPQEVDGQTLDVRATVYRAMSELHSRGEVVTASTVKVLLATYLRDTGLNDRFCTYVDRLATRATHRSLEEVQKLVETITTAAIVREIETRAERLQQMAHDKDPRAIEYLDTLQAFAKSGVSVDPYLPYGQRVQAAIERIEAVQEGRALASVPTSFPRLDGYHLFRAGNYVVLAARTNVGKSALAGRVASWAAKCGYPVLFVSMEMPSDDICERVLSGAAHISHERMATRGGLTADDWTAIVAEAAREVTWKLDVMDTGRRDIEAIEMRTRLTAARWGRVGLLVIDYAQKLHRDKAWAKLGRREWMVEISGALKDMAMDFKCPVLCLSQLNRAAAFDPDRRPTLEDIAESDAFGQDADTVLLMSRDMTGCKSREEYDALAERPMLIEIAKSRNGATGDVRLKYRHDQTLFVESAL